MTVAALASFRRLVAALAERSPLLLPAYAAGFAAVAVFCLVRAPIVALDTDLWYHLSHGRALFETGQIPDTSAAFSFLEPARAWVDYYWGFQAGVYALHKLTGYGGLIVLRAALFAALLAAVAAILFRRRPGAPARYGWPTLVFILFLVQSLDKYALVRPHTVTYLAIAVFLWILERRPDRLILLPLVAVLWVNVHGVEYPVLILICVAYVVDLYAPALAARRSLRRRELRRLAALGASMAAIFLTPHGTALLRVPFTPTELTSVYLRELQRPELWEYFSYALSPLAFPALTAFNLLLVLALLTAAGAALAGRLRPGHLVLLAGGLYLLTRGLRFHQELALLALPLLARHGPPAALARGGARRPAAVLAAALLMLAPLPALRPHVERFAEPYPLSPRNLPHGAAAFLERLDAGGTVLNPPNFGGYLHWRLVPDYRIAIDMEVPFLFTDDDLYRVLAAFDRPEPLRRLLERHRPDFLAAPLTPPEFRDLIRAHPRYVPVFVDDLVAVYVDADAHPQIAASHRLETLDPYRLRDLRFAGLSPQDQERHLEELERLAATDPDVVSVSQALAILHNLRGDHDAALERALAAVRNAPREPRGHAIAADALRGLGRDREALHRYRRAVKLAQTDHESRYLSRSLAAHAARLDRPREAYRALLHAVGPFNPQATPEDLFQLGVLAARAGDPQAARRHLDQARLHTPPDSPLRSEIQDTLSTLPR